MLFERHVFPYVSNPLPHWTLSQKSRQLPSPAPIPYEPSPSGLTGLAAIKGYGGVVLKTSFDETKEQALRDALKSEAAS